MRLAASMSLHLRAARLTPTGHPSSLLLASWGSIPRPLPEGRLRSLGLGLWLAGAESPVELAEEVSMAPGRAWLDRLLLPSGGQGAVGSPRCGEPALGGSLLTSSLQR